MIGNDIIDIKLARTKQNWQRPGYLEKLFTKQEQASILRAKVPLNQICLFWSMKESAYKITIQNGEKPSFAPKNLKCVILDMKRGYILNNEQRYHTYSLFNNNFIYTIASDSKQGACISDTLLLSNATYKNQSSQVNKHLKKRFSSEFNICKDKLILLKNKYGVPGFYYNNMPLKRSISTTHHGNFGAYAFSI